MMTMASKDDNKHKYVADSAGEEAKQKTIGNDGDDNGDDEDNDNDSSSTDDYLSEPEE
jgi:hypothetical protein